MKPWFSLSIIGCLLVSSGLGCGDGGTAPTDSSVDVERSALASSEAPVRHGPSAFVTDKIGHPLWEPVDFHQMTVDMTPYLADFRPALQQFLPPPNHTWHNALGLSPGAAHPPPYDDEIGGHVASLGVKTGSVFSTAEATWPNVLMSLWMVVPSEGAPLGSSPDFAQGPILPHTIFPIHVKIEWYIETAASPAFTSSFDVAALDTIDPPFLVEGHSHFPIFTFLGYGTAPPGRHFLHATMTDNEGNGWEIKPTFVLQATPAP